jgi:transcriptional regulator
MIRQTRLSVLVSNGNEGVPEISYLPLLFNEAEGPNGTHLGHFARAKPHWKSLRESRKATAIFMGPDAYVSPTWYPTKQIHHKHVPTWNYEVVHAICAVELFEDTVRLREAVSKLTTRYEAHRADPWTIDQAPPDFMEAQLKAIVGIKLSVQQLQGKRKLSQNRAPEDREGVRRALAESSDPGDQGVLASMLGLHAKAQKQS